MRDMTAAALPTGEEFLESLRDDREVWFHGERVKDVTTHPGFRNSARSLARLYSAMHDPALKDKVLVPTDTGNGGATHAAFRIQRTKDDLRAARSAIRVWQEQSFGWMGRTPDYKASLLTALGADPEFFGEYADNARFWYKKSQENVLHMAHAIINPPVDRSRPFDEVNDVFVHVEKETDAGLIVSGAKVVATGSPHTQYLFVSHVGAPATKKEFALAFICPTNAPGTKMFCRSSYEFNAAAATGPFENPLTSRLDENDAVLIFDKTLIPWENVIVYDIDRINRLCDATEWESRAILQASTRMSVKLDFLTGALSKALDITGAGKFRGVEAALGEVVNWRNALTAIRDGMIENATPGPGGSLSPCMAYGRSYSALAPKLYSRIREIIETVVASGLIYLNSHVTDLQSPEMRPYLDKYLRGSDGLTAHDRSKTMKLLWDAIGSEFGARHELYELNYFGAPEMNHLLALGDARRDGMMDHARSLVETCMSEYELTGWTVDDMFQPTDVSRVGRWQS